MQVKIVSDGEEYVGCNDKTKSKDEITDWLYENLRTLTRFQLEMKDGSVLILSGDKLRQSHIIVSD